MLSIRFYLGHFPPRGAVKKLKKIFLLILNLLSFCHRFLIGKQNNITYNTIGYVCMEQMLFCRRRLMREHVGLAAQNSLVFSSSCVLCAYCYITYLTAGVIIIFLFFDIIPSTEVRSTSIALRFSTFPL